MSKFLLIAGISLLLLASDTTLSLLLSVCLGLFLRNSVYTVSNIVSSTLFVDCLRLIFFGLPSILLLFSAKGFFHPKNKIAQLSLFNLTSYLLLCIACSTVSKSFANDAFTNEIFYLVALSTVMSPLLLSKLPVTKKLLTRI